MIVQWGIRSWLIGYLLVSIGALCPAVGWSQSDGAVDATLHPLEPLDDAAWTLADARHLLFRAGFGGTPEEVQRLHAMGLTGAVNHLVQYESVPDVDFPPPTAPRIELTPVELRRLPEAERMEIVTRFQRQNREFLNEFRRWWMMRMVATERPLEEKMVLFWHGHFATEARTVEISEAMYRQNELFRKHAAGNFGQLLHGIVRDAAMLRYLDNHRNVAGRPNENLARELLELFSMGEGSGYSERDIAEGARALTGYTFRRENSEFLLNVRQHDRGEKTIFGNTGRWNGDQFVALVLQQPPTARFIARKLFVYFVHDEPTDEMIEDLASDWRAEEYELRPLLRRLFMSQEFYSDRARGRLIKSPAELVIGTARSLGLRTPEPAGLLQGMRAMGQELLSPPNVRGWEGGTAWIHSNAVFARHNFVAAVLLSDRVPPRATDRPAMEMMERDRRDQRPGRPGRELIDWTARLREAGLVTPPEIADYFLTGLWAVPPSDAKRSELLAALDSLPDASEWSDRRRQVNQRLNEWLVLVMTQPEYQLN